MPKRRSGKRRKYIVRTDRDPETAKELVREVLRSSNEDAKGVTILIIGNIGDTNVFEQESSQTSDNSSVVYTGGDVRGAGNVLQAGHHNDASTEYLKIGLPPSGTVDIREELRAIREILTRLNSGDADDISAALSEADEAIVSDDDKDAVGEALERAIERASKASDFAEAVGRLMKHVVKAAAWLGAKWHRLVELVLACGP